MRWCYPKTRKVYGGAVGSQVSVVCLRMYAFIGSLSSEIDRLTPKASLERPHPSSFGTTNGTRESAARDLADQDLLEIFAFAKKYNIDPEIGVNVIESREATFRVVIQMLWDPKDF